MEGYKTKTIIFTDKPKYNIFEIQLHCQSNKTAIPCNDIIACLQSVTKAPINTSKSYIVHYVSCLRPEVARLFCSGQEISSKNFGGRKHIWQLSYPVCYQTIKWEVTLLELKRDDLKKINKSETSNDIIAGNGSFFALAMQLYLKYMLTV